MPVERPLGLLSEYVASPETLSRLEAIEERDLSGYVKAALRAGAAVGSEFRNWLLMNSVGESSIAELELNFKRFLALRVLHPSLTLAPSFPIDAVWHFFILDTAGYRNFCADVLGGTLDHHPGPIHDDEERSEETIETLEEAFGSANENIWPRGCCPCKG
jgi:hypothetical protein